MNADHDDERYNDILKKIAEARPFGRSSRELLPQTPHDRALDRINAYDALSLLTRKDYRHVLCYGPKPVRGAAWSAVVVWYHRKDTTAIRPCVCWVLWAHFDYEQILLSIAERQLPYRAPVYDAGVYRVAIQSHFNLYYDDAGGPPEAGDKLLHRCRFQENERLTHRQTLKEIVAIWQRQLETS